MWRPAVAWDPILISTQIVILQCIFYLSVGFWLFFSNMLLGTVLDLNYIFDSNSISFTSSYSYPAIVSFLLAAPVNALGLTFVVGRARKCLDYGSTIYLWHFVVCSLIYGFPSTSWWVLSVIGAVITIVLGECLSMRMELRSIPTLNSNMYGESAQDEAEGESLVGPGKV